MVSDSTDEDSTMDDAGFVPDTPRTASIALSDSQVASEESTRASTPTENRIGGSPSDVVTLKAIGDGGVADDATMRGIGAPQRPVSSDTGKSSNLKAIPWPSGTVIDPGTSPWKAKKLKEEGVDFASDAEQREGLLYLGDQDMYEP